ncbi:MAG: MIP/aquaporin family protein [Micropepsaceae bacterium]
MKPTQLRANSSDMIRKLCAEAVGSTLLLSIVVGSGIMAERLSGGSAGLALLGNAFATGAGLIVLILMFGPVSGAHFNPVVSLVESLQGKLAWSAAAGYASVQVAGAVAGVWLAHAMFDEPIWQLSTKARDGSGQMISEAVATFGLLGTIMCTSRFRPEVTPFAVGLYIASAYWFTASTSFANPAVTFARSMSDTFAGIAPASAPAFIAAQIAGSLAGYQFFKWLLLADRANGQ